MSVDLNDNKIKGLNRISKNLSEVLIQAFEFAKKRNGQALSSKDIFLAVLSHKNNIAARLLEKLGVDLQATIGSLSGVYSGGATGSFNPYFGEEAKQLLTNSFLLASELNHVYVGTEHMLLAILQLDQLDFVQDLAGMGFNFEFVKQSILNFGIYQPGIFTKMTDQPEEEEQQSGLNFFARNMNQLAQEGRYLKVWGREDEVARIIHILSRRTKNNPILVGEAGVGKTAIVEGFVQRILSGNVPKSFKNKTVIQLDLSAVIAGSKIRGDVEERLLSIVSEMAQNKDLILFIDEIHMIVGAGAAGSGSSMDIANILKPYLTNGDLRVIGATTFDEYQKYFEEDEALARRFQPIRVEEISVDDAEKVLGMLKSEFENFHKVKITDDAIHEAVVLSDRYITDKYLPDKAIDVLDEATSAKKIAKEKVSSDKKSGKDELKKIKKLKNKSLDEGDLAKASFYRKEEKRLTDKVKRQGKRPIFSKSGKYTVNAESIREVIASWSKIPVTTMKGSDVKNLKLLERNLGKRIIGQKEAVRRVAAALKRARVGISDEKRPMASFLFLGPTGVGKSETAKEIARTLFGSEDALIQVDMTEFMEQHSISKLIGSPPGYVGYQEGGQLTEKVRRRPYSVILFDEIEKAHPEMLNIMLQILEEGRLQDGKGRKVNFKNTVIILTSNIGASEIGKDDVLGFGVEDAIQPRSKMDGAFKRMEEKLMAELKDELPPEFINRIDDIVIFRGLDETDIRKITKLLVTEINKRLLEKGVQLLPTQSAINFIADEGYSKEYGARNIRRKLQELVENPLADYILELGVAQDRKADPRLVKVVKGKGGIKFS
ncbi:MAG: ATP-dependent Clp protease ATP-binding subunit [Candidatus Dojkabacteria bacterium]